MLRLVLNSHFTFCRLSYKNNLNASDTEETMKKVWGIYQDEVPAWQRHILTVAMPLLRLFVTKKMCTESPEDMKKAQDEVDSVNAEVSFSPERSRQIDVLCFTKWALVPVHGQVEKSSNC
jgi:hypothetical protein